MAFISTTSEVSGGDHSWLGSRHGVSVAESGTLNVSAFNLDTDVVPSGYPVADDQDGLLVPYTGGVGQNLRGFVIGDQPLDGTAVVPVLWTGRIVVDNLPVDFTVPDTPGQFVYA